DHSPALALDCKPALSLRCFILPPALSMHVQRLHMMRPRSLTILALIFTATILMVAQAKPRARDLGVPFDGTPGPLNSITDVKGVEVGHTTLISASGKLKVGEGPLPP